ncbi:hypothetical protein O9992_04580 [Vibrio lentus]|nr:hypothetical protein [Vibrio lentus]
MRTREMEKLEKSLWWYQEHGRPLQTLYSLSMLITKHIAVKEVNNPGIPVYAVVDTQSPNSTALTSLSR